VTPRTFSFTVHGAGELQRVDVTVTVEADRAVLTLAVQHVEFNLADGTDEATRRWTEVWETTLDGRVTAISRDGVPGRSRLLPSSDPAPGDTVVLREPGELVIERAPRAPLPRAPEALEAERREAAWRLARLKSGEDPDERG
jgi:hypothetical protein